MHVFARAIDVSLLTRPVHFLALTALDPRLTRLLITADGEHLYGALVSCTAANAVRVTLPLARLAAMAAEWEALVHDAARSDAKYVT